MSFDRRIVFDTGVLVSAALRPASVRALALEKGFLNFDLCVSRATLDELCAVLMRKKFAAYAPELARRQFLAGFTERAILFDVSSRVSDCTDAKDNKFLELALDCEAELIVASDAHLTTLHPWRSIPIMPPSAFLVGVRGQPPHVLRLKQINQSMIPIELLASFTDLGEHADSSQRL